MSNIIDIREQFLLAKRGEPTDPSFEQFLNDEGLLVLSAYRSIRDDTVRMGVRALLETLAGSSVGTPKPD